MTNSTVSYVPVVLAGGSGTRLWPLSRIDFPKQYLSPTGGKDSLLQSTLKRFDRQLAESAVLVCSESHRFLAAEQLTEIGLEGAEILLEPVGRNTAPAIAVAAWHLMKQDKDTIMVVSPSDHLIQNTDYFKRIVQHACAAAAQDNLVTLGVAPTGPATGYGYIESVAAENGNAEGQPLSVKRFIEKPDGGMAEELIRNPDCYWNAGIFVFRAALFLQALSVLDPEMYQLSRASVEGAIKDLDFIRLAPEPFEACETISVDYAVMEKADNVVVLPYQSDWSDVGSWDAVHQSMDHDVHRNSGVGDVMHQDCTDTHLHASSRLVVAVGTSNISVIETSDAVLVIDNKNAQSIKHAIDHLKAESRAELVIHKTCYRPWGHYESLKLHPRFQVKRICVNPGGRLSLQKHFHRSEHWVVVRGTALVTNGDEELLLTENESTYIPLGVMHRLHNPGSIPLELIEVQSGSYLGEDDIVRFGDEYGRV